MRPPFITAEWLLFLVGYGIQGQGFNEAAVHHGGVVVVSLEYDLDFTASMRPPFITAEW